MSEDTPPTESKNKRFDLSELEKRFAFDVQTDNLGILKGGSFTLGAMISLEPLLKATPQVPDEELARAAMRSIIRHPPVGEEREGEELSEEEALKLTDADVERFAELLLKCERRSSGTDETGSPISPASALAMFVRDSRDKMTKSTERWTKAFGESVLSKGTLEALNAQALWAEKMNPLTGLQARLANLSGFDYNNKISELASKAIPDYIRVERPPITSPLRPTLMETTRNIPSAAQLMRDNTKQVVEAISATAAEAEQSRKINSDATTGILADVLNKIERQINTSEENTDKLIKQSIEGANSNASSQRKSLNLAIIAIIVSIVTGGFGTWVAWKSYTHDLAVEISEQQEKEATQRLKEEEKILLQESLAEQKEQNRILRELMTKTSKVSK